MPVQSIISFSARDIGNVRPEHYSIAAILYSFTEETEKQKRIWESQKERETEAGSACLINPAGIRSSVFADGEFITQRHFCFISLLNKNMPTRPFLSN